MRGARPGVLAALVLAAGIAAGCTDFGSIDAACPGGGEPVNVEEIVRVLRDQGFSVSAQAEAFDCNPEVNETYAANPVVGYVTNEQIGSGDAVVAGEGLLMCTVRRGDEHGLRIGRRKDVGPSSPVYGGRHDELTFGNVECLLYVATDADERRVARAFDVLSRHHSAS